MSRRRAHRAEDWADLPDSAVALYRMRHAHQHADQGVRRAEKCPLCQASAAGLRRYLAEHPEEADPDA